MGARRQTRAYRRHDPRACARGRRLSGSPAAGIRPASGRPDRWPGRRTRSFPGDFETNDLYGGRRAPRNFALRPVWDWNSLDEFCPGGCGKLRSIYNSKSLAQTRSPHDARMVCMDFHLDHHARTLARRVRSQIPGRFSARPFYRGLFTHHSCGRYARDAFARRPWVDLQKKNWPLRIGLITGLIAMLARAGAPFSKGYVMHLELAAILWIVGLAIWGYRLIKLIAVA